MPGVKQVVNETWFGGQYKDDKAENFFAQFGTDPQELFQVYTDFHIPPDQLEAWQKDRAGCVADAELAKKYGWKIGDRIPIKGTIFPLNLELTLRGIYTAPQNTQTLYFNNIYMDEGYARIKGSGRILWRAGRFSAGSAAGGQGHRRYLPQHRPANEVGEREGL